MAALNRWTTALLVLTAVPTQAEPVTSWQPDVTEASVRFGVPERWIIAVIRAESGGRTSLGGRPILSPAGAMGLMQLMPGTWAQMRSLLQLGGDPYQPRDNILAGTAYLRLMYERFGYPGLFAAYNAGPERLADHRDHGVPLPRETVAYLAQIVGRPASGSRSAIVHHFTDQRQRLFVPIGPARGDDPFDLVPNRSGLFVPLTSRAVAR